MSHTRLLKRLEKRLPRGVLSFDERVREVHGADRWFATAMPEVVARPRTSKAVSEILKFAHQHGIPVTTRGAGHGYVGGCVPVKGGILLSVAGMKRIREINERDFVAVVGPGVITANLQEKAAAKGLYYPPDPASRADCSIGGNIATNAGGPRCLKYGVTRDYVLGLEVVLADGTVFNTGSRTHKNKSGFDLHRLFVGSEGMLGVVTGATLKLLPLPPYRAALSAGFKTMSAAAKAIRDIFANGFLPSAVEVADAFTLRAAEKRTRNAMFSGCNAHLIVELDGQERSVKGDLNVIGKILKSPANLFIERAMGEAKVEAIWQLRREFSYSLRDTGLTKLNEDITVPRGRLEDLFRFASKLQKRHGFPVACFGHAGDGNIHVNVMVDFEQPNARRRSDKCLDELFGQIVAWGVVTGEHGIGLAKKPWWKLAASKEVDDLHRRVKSALDPKDILNPGKFL